MSRKRTREVDLQIKAADGELLQGEAYIVRACSSVAREIPVDTSEWDVSGLLLDGEPFSSKTVKCWLSCACSVLHGPAELDSEDKQQLNTAKELHQLLAFASAVGSTEMLLTVACSRLDHLRSVVSVQDKQAVLFMQAGLKVAGKGGRTFGSVGGGGPVRWSPQQGQEAKQQVAAQTSALLHMAHTLRLQPLLDVLHGFLFGAGSKTDGLLYGMLDLVFTEAVLDAAVGSGTISKEVYINSVLTRPCALQGTSVITRDLHLNALLEPVGSFTCDPDSGQLHFKAKLLQNFARGRVGDNVRVTIGLFGNNAHLELLTEADAEYVFWTETSSDDYIVTFPAQLLLGTSIASRADLMAAMRSRLPV